MAKHNDMICEVELENSFNLAEEIVIYNDGKTTKYSSGSKEYEAVQEGWSELLDGAHYMPAFGVSIHRYTVEALKSGLWVEFDYGKLYQSYGLDFEKLLINVVPEDMGFNIIRYTEEYGYDGRCFYFDLNNKNSSAFYDILINL